MSLNLLMDGSWPITQTVDLGNSIVDRPAPTASPTSQIHYLQVDGFIDTIKDVPHIWYFTLAKGFSPDACTAKWWHEAFEECLSAHPLVNIAYNLEYHSDAVTLHAHGIVYDTEYKVLQKMKRDLRKSFKIDSRNRVAIKWYQNNNKSHTHKQKILYHLVSIDYNNRKKYNLMDQFTSIKRSDAGA